MTGEIINLRRERKRRFRAAEAGAAEANRARHGLRKSGREAIRVERDTAERRLDQHALTPGGEAPGAGPRER
jgi:5'-3' exonuclease